LQLSLFLSFVKGTSALPVQASSTKKNANASAMEAATPPRQAAADPCRFNFEGKVRLRDDNASKYRSLRAQNLQY